MSSSQLWSPQPQRQQAQSPVERANARAPNMLPGTWLSLSPVTSVPVGSLSPSVSSLPSPALKADASPIDLKDLDSKFLSNISASRQSSFSSQGSVDDPMRRPLKSTIASPDLERREIAIRSGRIARE